MILEIFALSKYKELIFPTVSHLVTVAERNFSISYKHDEPQLFICLPSFH